MREGATSQDVMQAVQKVGGQFQAIKIAVRRLPIPFVVFQCV